MDFNKSNFNNQTYSDYMGQSERRISKLISYNFQTKRLISKVAAYITIDDNLLPEGIILKAESLTINKPEINARKVANFTLINLTNIPYKPQFGQDVKIYIQGELIFGGVIDEPSEYKINAKPVKIINVAAVDYHKLTDKRRINESYPKQPVEDIVNHIITNYLAVEGITAGIIQEGPEVGILNFPYIPVSQALKEISDLVGYQWKINPNKTLDFIEMATNTGPSLKEADDYLFNSLRTWDDGSDYRTKQILRGIKGETVEITELMNPSPDGAVQTFYIRYPIARKPIIEINTGSGFEAVNENYVGILGLDEDKEWYWNVNRNVITQDFDETPLPMGSEIRLVYKGIYTINLEIENQPEIAQRAIIENNSGLYEFVENADANMDLETGTEKVNSLLRQYGQIVKKFVVSSYSKKWEVGQICNVNIPSLNLIGDFLVMSLTITMVGNRVLRTAEFVSGENVGGWVSFFRKWLENITNLTIRENEVVRKIKNIQENQGISSEYLFNIYESLYPSETLYPDEELYPGTFKQEVNLLDD